MNQLDYKYARGLLDVAKEAGKLEAFQEQLAFILDVLEQAPDMERFLESPKISPSYKKEFISSVFSRELDQEIMNFIFLLIDRNRQGRLKEIARVFIELGNRERNIVKAFAYTTEPLDQDEKELVKQNLSRMLNKTVLIENVIDRDILGGIKVMAGDRMLDGSLKNKLHHIRKLMEGAKLEG